MSDSVNNTPNLSGLGDTLALLTAVGKASANFRPLPRTATGQVGKDRKFQYAPYHKVVECIKPQLTEQNVSFVQILHNDNPSVACLTLVVSCPDGSLTSNLVFSKNPDIKLFGADVTYHKRYQLTSFFGLEGDPDADDFETPQVEIKPATVKAEADKEVTPTKTEPVTAKETTPVAKSPEPVKAAPSKDNRTVNEKLTDALKQLTWKISPDLDNFCKENSEVFPDFTSAAKLTAEQKEKLYKLLVEKKNVAPF
jgi:hypothetical protein